MKLRSKEHEKSKSQETLRNKAVSWLFGYVDLLYTNRKYYIIVDTIIKITRLEKEIYGEDVMETKEWNENQRVNKVVLQCYGTLVVVLFLAYLAEAIKGNRTLGYIALFDLFLLGPFLITYLAYRKNRENLNLRHFVGLGYGIMYLFVLMTSVTKIKWPSPAGTLLYANV